MKKEELEKIKEMYPEYIPEKTSNHFKDLTGMIFGRLKVLYRTFNKVYKSGQCSSTWVCKCECGNIITAITSNLNNGKVVSCGCYNYDRIRQRRKFNVFDIISYPYGIGWTTNTNKEFYFDLEDFDIISKYCWYENDQGYIIATLSHTKNIRMHRLILNVKDNELVDHINNNRNDNRKENLRIANKSTNGINRGCNKNNELQIKGVFFSRGKYNVRIMKDGKNYYIGVFDTIEEAQHARIEKERELFGEFAYE
jgi:hypothetical protein